MAAAAPALCDWSLHPSVTSWRDDTAGDMAWCVERGLPSFKVYLAYQERGLGLRDRDLLRVLSAAAAAGALVLAHCENGDAVSFLTQRLLAGGRRAARFHPLSRPPEVEAEAVERALILAADSRLRPVRGARLDGRGGGGDPPGTPLGARGVRRSLPASPAARRRLLRAARTRPTL